MTKRSELTEGLRDLPLQHLVEDLRERSGSGEVSAAFREVIRRFEPLLRDVWKRSAFDVEYEDFRQEVFLRLLRFIEKLTDPKSFPGYFRRIVLSVAADQGRKKQTLPEAEELDEDELPPELIARIDRVLVSGLSIRSYLEHLPPREREVVRLTIDLDLRPSEMSEVLGISPSAVRATKNRAIKRLRSLFMSEADALEQGLEREKR